MSIVDIAQLEARFPFLRGADTAVKEELQPYAQVMDVPVGTHICWEGDACSSLALLLSGSVRVYKVGENGREITLYHVEENESCILTASCILSQTPFPALAVVETPAQAIMIPARVVRAWVDRYDVWRDYLFSLMSQRLSLVIATVEEVAFRRVDARIAEFLANLGPANEPVTITHQEIAFEIGTAREVVSRILKDFERAELIALARGSVTILDKPGLLAKV